MGCTQEEAHLPLKLNNKPCICLNILLLMPECHSTGLHPRSPNNRQIPQAGHGGLVVGRCLDAVLVLADSVVAAAGPRRGEAETDRLASSWDVGCGVQGLDLDQGSPELPCHTTQKLISCSLSNPPKYSPWSFLVLKVAKSYLCKYKQGRWVVFAQQVFQPMEQ